MNKKSKKIVGTLFVFLFLILASVSPVLASSPSTPAHPKYPYIVWDVSIRKTVVVHVLNATPYVMEYKDSTFANAVVSSTTPVQNYANSAPPIAFTPSGIPYKLPAKTGASFAVSWLDVNDKAASVLANAYVNFQLDNVDSSSMYTVAGCTINPQIGNVRLLLNFDRVKETRNLKSEIYKTILHTSAALVDALEIAMEPANPLAWAGFITASQEAAEDIKTLNSENQSEDQLFVSAFVPQYNNNMDLLPGIISLYQSDEGASDYDGITTQQPSGNGCPQSSLAVGLAVLREKAPDAKSLDGSLPAVFLVVATIQDWTAAGAADATVTRQDSPAGYEISQQLKREGKNGRKALFKLVRTMNASDLHMMQSAYNSIHAHKPLSQHQEALLAKLAAAFAKHAETMPAEGGVNRPGSNISGPNMADHQTPVHRNK